MRRKKHKKDYPPRQHLKWYERGGVMTHPSKILRAKLKRQEDLPDGRTYKLLGRWFEYC